MPGMPEHLKEKVEEAKKIAAEMYKEPTEPEPEVKQEPSPAPETAPVEPEPEIVASSTPAEIEEPLEEPVQKPPVQQQPDKDSAYWQQSFKVAEGRLKKTAQENKELRDQVRELQQSISRLTVLVEQRTQQQTEQKIAPATSIPQDEDMEAILAEYADEPISKLLRRQQEIIARQSREVEAIKQQMGTVNTNMAQTVEQRFWGELASQVPNYADINQDSRWLEWLSQSDELSGDMRQAILDRAVNEKNPRKVANIFKTFMKTLPLEETNGHETSATVPMNQGQTNPSLARQIAPERSRTTVEKFTSPKGKVYGEKEYRAKLATLTSQLNRGEITRDDWTREWQDLQKAYSEGRVKV